MMRSTKQFLEQPFKPGKGTHQQRLEQLNQQSSYAITPPEQYCDINGMLMDNPCDIGTTDSPCYVDARARTRYVMHPKLSDSNQSIDKLKLGRKDPNHVEWEKNWHDGVYKVNQPLANEIKAWLTIEEIRRYANRLSTTRRRALKTVFPTLDYQSRQVLFATAANVLKETGRSEEFIPTEFTSAVTGKLMTLPVKIDGGHIIDFSELLTTTDATTISHERLETLLEEFRAYCKEDLAAIENQCTYDLVNLDVLSEETFNPSLKSKMVAGATARFQQTKLEHEKSMTLEWYVEHFKIPALMNILDNYKKYGAKEKERISKGIEHCRQSLQKLRELNQPEKFVDGKHIETEDTPEEIAKSIADYEFNGSNAEKNLAAFENKFTLEWYIKHFCLADATYLNPFTKAPVLSIEIDVALLKKIDHWIDPVEEQIRVVKAHVAASTPTLAQQTYADTLAEKIANGLYPANKIREALKVAHIPLENKVEIPSHPVRLDGDRVIDYWRLKDFWENKGVIGYVISFFYPLDWHGYNPFTGKKCESVEYMHDLKKEIDNFMCLEINVPTLLSETAARKDSFHLFSLFQPAARTAMLENILFTTEFKQ